MIKKIPVTVGVIGHLDAVITEEHRELVVSLFEDIHSSYPGSPVCLFSQLAPGADTVVAQIFLELKKAHDRDYELIAPLPMDIQQYTAGFSEAQKQQFEILLAAAAKYYVLDRQKSVPSTDDHYREGGRFVADSSLILLALWDQESNGMKGGTADLVAYKKKGSFDDSDVNTIFEMKGALIELPCNRASTPKPKAVTLPAGPLLLMILKDEAISKALQKISHFNRAHDAVLEKKISSSAEHLYPGDKPLDSQNAELRDYYALADTLALREQSYSDKVLKSLFLLGLGIIVFFECYKHLNPGAILLLVSTVVLMIAAYGIHRFLNHGEIHEKFLSDRVLAEALRIQFYWNLGGVRKSVAHYLLRIHRAEFAWIKYVINLINGLTYTSQQQNAPVLGNVRTLWIEDQLGYFHNGLKKRERPKKNLILLSRITLALAFLLILSMIFFHGFFHHHENWHHMVIVLVGILFGIFALARGYISKKGYETIHNQYALMRDIYLAASTTLKEAEQRGEKGSSMSTDVFYLAGKEALIEIGNWYLIFKEREPEVEGIGG
jgi:hypothetical protein